MTGTGTTEDTAADRAIYNFYNQVPRNFYAQVPAASWTYNTATLRASDANSTLGQGRIQMVIGVANSNCNVNFMQPIVMSNGAGAAYGVSALGLDSTTTASSALAQGGGISTGTFTQQVYATNTVNYSPALTVGIHYIQMLEEGSGASTSTFYGNGTPSNSLTGNILQ